MKGVQGLLLSVGLGFAGAICNWMYLERLAGKEARVSFIAIKGDQKIDIGDTLRADQLVEILIPRSAVGNLEQVAPRWNDGLKLVTGATATRSYRGGELVLHQDLLTPGSKDLNEKIGKNEVALWIPIDTRTFNSSRVNPNDEVSFILPRTGGPTLAVAAGENDAPSAPTWNSEIVGPFRILEIGNRTGRPEIQRAAGNRQAADSSITVVAKLENGHLDSKSEKITDYLRTTKAQGLQVILHSKN